MCLEKCVPSNGYTQYVVPVYGSIRQCVLHVFRLVF